jgi:hypothetical protein
LPASDGAKSRLDTRWHFPTVRLATDFQVYGMNPDENILFRRSGFFPSFSPKGRVPLATPVCLLDDEQGGQRGTLALGEVNTGRPHALIHSTRSNLAAFVTAFVKAAEATTSAAALIRQLAGEIDNLGDRLSHSYAFVRRESASSRAP